jgi:hypothetical protein
LLLLLKSPNSTLPALPVGGATRCSANCACWARPPAGDDRAQARGHRGVPSLRWITRSLDHPTPTAHDVVRAVVRGTRRQLGIALVEIVAARAQPALRATSPAISLRAGFATAAARGRSLGGRDHASRALEERADRPPLHPPGRPLGR